MKGSKHLTIVIKIGTSSIVDETTHEPILPILSLIVDTAIKLRRDGHRVVIVSSGAIGVGLQRMNIAKRPKHLPQTQALAAIGQCRLISIWDSLFAHMHQPVAQILLTRNDIADRSQYLNAQNTFAEVLNYGVIPIVNENDTLAVSEIKFGDNDTLSAITAAMVHADYLFLMTDVEALYDKNPRTHPDAKPIRTVEDIDNLQVDVSSRGSDLGTGGMGTKIVAARLATSAGTTTIITKSSKPGNIKDIINFFHPPTAVKSSTNVIHEALSASQTLTEPPLHTRFLPLLTPIRNRAFWILHGLVPQGTIYIDSGASRALHAKAGLLPVGIVDVKGDFAAQEAVRLIVVDRKSYISSIGTSDRTRDLSDSTDDLSSTGTPASLRSSTPGTPSRTPSSFLTLHHNTSLSSSTTTLVPEGLTAIAGEEIGRALTNYSASQIHRIKGLRSSEIVKVLGFADTEYVAFRENVSLLASVATNATGGNGTSRPHTPLANSGIIDSPDNNATGSDGIATTPTNANTNINANSSSDTDETTTTTPTRPWRPWRPADSSHGSVTPLGNTDGGTRGNRSGTNSGNRSLENSIGDLKLES